MEHIDKVLASSVPILKSCIASIEIIQHLRTNISLESAASVVGLLEQEITHHIEYVKSLYHCQTLAQLSDLIDDNFCCKYFAGKYQKNNNTRQIDTVL